MLYLEFEGLVVKKLSFLMNSQLRYNVLREEPLILMKERSISQLLLNIL